MTETKASAAEHAKRVVDHSETRARLMREYLEGTANFSGAGPHYDKLGAYADSLASDRDRLSVALTDAVYRANHAIDDACVHHGRVLELETELAQERAKLQAAERVVAACRPVAKWDDPEVRMRPWFPELHEALAAYDRDGSRAGGAGGKEGT